MKKNRLGMWLPKTPPVLYQNLVDEVLRDKMEDFLFLDAPPTSSYYKKYKWLGDDIPDDQESANQVDSYGAQGLGDSECFSTTFDTGTIVTA